MFSTEELIKASRDFVCVRIETFENKESEKLVKKVLGGIMANTAFVILDPSGTKPLTRSGRSPGMAMMRGPSRTETDGSQNATVISQMKKIAGQYRAKGGQATAELQDFHSLRQALNCASADQRLLVFVNAPESKQKDVEKELQSVFADDEIIGKLHLDFADAKTDQGWARAIKGAQDKAGIVVIRSSQFGVDGTALDQLSLNADADDIKDALLKANTQFAKVERRKNYEQHVQAGRRQGMFFENEISREDAVDGPQNRNGPGQGGGRPPRGRK